jgi:hypothetical protein
MSVKRRRKKAAWSRAYAYELHDGTVREASAMSPRDYRFNVLWEKRRRSDPAYLISQTRTQAPVKYSRCKTCVGRPHHSPWFGTRGKSTR